MSRPMRARGLKQYQNGSLTFSVGKGSDSLDASGDRRGPFELEG